LRRSPGSLPRLDASLRALTAADAVIDCRYRGSPFPVLMKQQARLAATGSKIRRELLKTLSKALRLPPAGTRFEGLKLRIPLIYGLGADHLSRTLRPWTYHFLARLLPSRPGTFVDIGANVGLYLIWLKSIDENREYIGFEPNPACYFYLQELMRCNQFAASSVFPLALSDDRALSTFFARRLGDKMGSLRADHRVEKERPYSFNVLTEPGDPVFDDLDLATISAIKIDVEGLELQVLRGLAATLERYRPVVICEVLAPAPDRPGFGDRRQNIEELLSLAEGIGYRLLFMGTDEQLHTACAAEDLLAQRQPDCLLVPAGELEHTLELWRDARSTLSIRY
jgi:FkbM family methyltransferase